MGGEGIGILKKTGFVNVTTNPSSPQKAELQKLSDATERRSDAKARSPVVRTLGGSGSVASKKLLGE